MIVDDIGMRRLASAVVMRAFEDLGKGSSGAFRFLVVDLWDSLWHDILGGVLVQDAVIREAYRRADRFPGMVERSGVHSRSRR